jgi:hypothetical protein
MSLFNYSPFLMISVSEETIDQFHGPIIGRRPSPLKKASIVKDCHTTWYYEAAPVIPIALDGRLRVVSID